MILDEWPLNLIIKTMKPGELFGFPGFVYISGAMIHESKKYHTTGSGPALAFPPLGNLSRSFSTVIEQQAHRIQPA